MSLLAGLLDPLLGWVESSPLMAVVVITAVSWGLLEAWRWLVSTVYSLLLHLALKEAVIIIATSSVIGSVIAGPEAALSLLVDGVTWAGRLLGVL